MKNEPTNEDLRAAMDRIDAQYLQAVPGGTIVCLELVALDFVIAAKMTKQPLQTVLRNVRDLWQSVKMEVGDPPELLQTAYQALLEKGFSDTSITVIAFETKFFAGIGTRYAMRVVFDHSTKLDSLYTGVEQTPEQAAAKLMLLIRDAEPFITEDLGNQILGIQSAA